MSQGRLPLGQARGLLWLPGGWPLHLGGALSETGSAGVGGSSQGRTSAGGCSACVYNAGADSCTGADSFAGFVDPAFLTSVGRCCRSSLGRSVGKEKGSGCSLTAICGAKSGAGIRPSNSWCSKYCRTLATNNSTGTPRFISGSTM